MVGGFGVRGRIVHDVFHFVHLGRGPQFLGFVEGAVREGQAVGVEGGHFEREVVCRCVLAQPRKCVGGDNVVQCKRIRYLLTMTQQCTVINSSHTR